MHRPSRVVSAGVVAAVLTIAAVVPPGLADTTPPTITVIRPATGAIFDQRLHLKVSASDPDGLGRVTFEADGKTIKSFIDHLSNGAPVGLNWHRARDLSLGEHTISVIALDSKGSNPVTRSENTAVVKIKVRRVDATKLPRVHTAVGIALTGTGLDRTVRGRVTAKKTTVPLDEFALTGKARVTWQIFSQGHFKTRHRGTGVKIAPYKLSQHLAGKGRWRVSVRYDPRPPYAASTSKSITFTVH